MYNQQQQHPYAHTNGMNSRSRSVPEGLAQPNGDVHWNYSNRNNFHRTPSRQPVQVLEQITTSVWPKMNFQNFFICFCIYVVEGIVAVASWSEMINWVKCEFIKKKRKLWRTHGASTFLEALKLILSVDKTTSRREIYRLNFVSPPRHLNSNVLQRRFR